MVFDGIDENEMIRRFGGSYNENATNSSQFLCPNDVSSQLSRDDEDI